MTSALVVTETEYRGFQCQNRNRKTGIKNRGFRFLVQNATECALDYVNSSVEWTHKIYSCNLTKKIYKISILSTLLLVCISSHNQAPTVFEKKPKHLEKIILILTSLCKWLVTWQISFGMHLIKLLWHVFVSGKIHSYAYDGFGMSIICTRNICRFAITSSR